MRVGCAFDSAIFGNEFELHIWKKPTKNEFQPTLSISLEPDQKSLVKNFVNRVKRRRRGG